MAVCRPRGRGAKKWRLNRPRFFLFLAVALAALLAALFLVRAADPDYEWPAALRFIQRPTFGQGVDK